MKTSLRPPSANPPDDHPSRALGDCNCANGLGTGSGQLQLEESHASRTPHAPSRGGSKGGRIELFGPRQPNADCGSGPRRLPPKPRETGRQAQDCGPSEATTPPVCLTGPTCTNPVPRPEEIQRTNGARSAAHRDSPRNAMVTLLWAVTRIPTEAVRLTHPRVHVLHRQKQRLTPGARPPDVTGPAPDVSSEPPDALHVTVPPAPDARRNVIAARQRASGAQ